MIEKVRKEAVQGVADNGGNLEQVSHSQAIGTSKYSRR